MTTTTDETTDTGKTLKEATDLLTVGEIRWAGRHYGQPFEDLPGLETLVTVVLLHERRKAMQEGSALPDWAQMDEWTLRRLQDYFAPEPIEVDESDPESESGKGTTSAA